MYLNGFDMLRNGASHDQSWAKWNMQQFHKSMQFVICQCMVCKEAWPINAKPKSAAGYMCSRCSRDKCVPKKFSDANAMIPTPQQYILRNAAAKLKDHPFQEANLFISDDVSRKVREDRKKLKENHLDAIRAREDVEFAFIPWSVPARILFKSKDTDKLKSFSLIALADTGEIESGQG